MKVCRGSKVCHKNRFIQSAIKIIVTNQITMHSNVFKVKLKKLPRH